MTFQNSFCSMDGLLHKFIENKVDEVKNKITYEIV